MIKKKLPYLMTAASLAALLTASTAFADSNVTVNNAASANGAFDGASPTNTYTPTNNNAVADRNEVEASLNAGDSVLVQTSGGAGAQAGDITVSSTITKTAGGDSTLTLDATNDISIDNTISSSTGALDIRLISGNDLDLNGGIDANGGDLTLEFANTGTQSGGVISGTTNVIKAGTGDMTLSQGNTYNGATTIQQGTLTVTNNAGLGTAAGDTTVNAGTTLVLDNVNIGAEDIDLRGTLEGENVSTLGGDVTLTTGSQIGGTGTLTISGVIDGTDLEKVDAGTLSLTGANTYTGTTTITDGTLRVDGSALPDGTAVTLSNNAGATLDLNGATETIGSLAGGGTTGGNVTLGAGTLVTGGDNTSTSYGGTISGTGGLTKAGIGTMTLTGTNTYTGTTTITGGILLLNNASNDALADTGTVSVGASGTLSVGNATSETIGSLTGAGSVVLNSNLLVGTAASTTFSGIISGTGNFTKQGAGTLTLSGTNTLTGGITINAGTLRVDGGTAIPDTRTVVINGGGTLDVNVSETVGGISGAGNVSIGASQTLTTGGNNVSTTLSGVISGGGGLTKTGTGTLTLSGSNTYTGDTNVNAGTLDLDGDLTSDTTLAAGTTLDIDAAGTLTGDITNAGTVSNDGTVAGNVSNDSTFTSAGGVTGDFANNTAGTYTNTGTLVGDLTNDGTYTGDGSITGNVTHNGTYQPGNADIGTSTITGNITFANNSTYEAEINPAGTSDLIDVTGAATINGGDIQLVAQGGGTYANGQTFTILNTTGGVTGTFSNVTGTAFFVPTLNHLANQVDLQIAVFTFSQRAVTANQQAVAAALDAANAAGELQTAIGALLNVPTAAAAQAAYDSFSSDRIGNMQRIAMESSFQTLTTVTGRMNELRAVKQRNKPMLIGGTIGSRSFNVLRMQDPGASRVAMSGPMLAGLDASTYFNGNWQDTARALDFQGIHSDALRGVPAPTKVGFWMRGYVGAGDVNTNEYDTNGIMAGFDHQFSPHFLAGISGGYARTDASFYDARSNTDVDTGHVSLYSSLTLGRFYVDNAATAAFNSFDQERGIDVGVLTETARANYSGWSGSGYAETGFQFNVGSVVFQPLVAGQYTYIFQDGYSETGSSANLTVDDSDSNSLRGTAAMRIAKEFKSRNRTYTYIPEVRFGASHEFADRDSTINTQFTDGPAGGTFPIESAAIDRNNALFGASFTVVNRPDKLSMFMDYSGSAGPDQSAHTVSGGFRYIW